MHLILLKTQRDKYKIATMKETFPQDGRFCEPVFGMLYILLIIRL